MDEGIWQHHKRGLGNGGIFVRRIKAADFTANCY
jgi:hypothetical protein